MNKSRRGYYYNLNESPYRVVIQDKIFVFSSPYRMDVFIREVNREKEKLQKHLEKLDYVSVINVGILVYQKAYDKAQPTNKLILDGDKYAAENSMEQGTNG